MPQEHYFSASPSGDLVVKRLTVTLAGQQLDVVTAGGVFSPGAVDIGTQVLLAHVPPPAPGGDLLDLGCGWGPVALSMAMESPRATVWAVDVNERSLELTRRNAESLGLSNINAVRPEDVPSDACFTTIWSNPPIRVGKNELHRMLDLWLPRLDLHSDAWLVVARNLGSDSLQRWIAGRYSPDLQVHRAATHKGFRVLRVRHQHDSSQPADLTL